MQNIGKHHEFQKDPMLKKLVLLSVAFFSIATELRMMAQFDGKSEKEKQELLKKSELFHAQSVYFGAYYLPANCPLVSHVSNSYNKHYLIHKKVDGEEKKSEVSKIDTKFQKNKIIQNFLIKKIPAEKKNSDSFLNLTNSDLHSEA